MRKQLLSKLIDQLCLCDDVTILQIVLSNLTNQANDLYSVGKKNLYICLAKKTLHKK